VSRNCIWLRVHLVWSTKCREPTIESAWQQDLYAYVAGIVRNKRCKLIGAGGTADHVHLYIALSNNLSVGSLVNTIKSNSAKWVNTNHGKSQPFRWQHGYGAFTMNMKNEKRLRVYIANQEKHHKRRSTEQEMVAFASMHGHRETEWLK
jgi:putative transposase